MKKNLTEWLRSGEFLPKVLRDFHDQKDVFKAFHSNYKINVPQPDNKNEYMMKEIRNLSFVSSQIFVIDFFLYFMARHGYVLIKSNQKIDFESLDETVKDFRDKELTSFQQMLQERNNAKCQQQD